LTPLPKAELKFHRKAAIECFNKTWDYLEMKSRGSEDERQMVHLAHASRYHWGLVGTAANKAVGEWQISRVYSALGQSDLALRFARSSLSACEKHGLSEVMPSAYEGLARAYAVAKNSKRAEEYLVKARRRLDKLALDKEDREIYLGQIRETQRLIDRS
jgi:hypothetical protein